MQNNPQHVDVLGELTGARYALLRSYRRNGTAINTPIWFDIQGRSVVFRTKVGAKTNRVAARPDVELTVCDYLGRVPAGATTFAGRATILSGEEAEEANRALHRRYGWQWNIVPMFKIPGVTNGHEDLSVGEKLRRMRNRNVWPDSAIVRVDLA